ncbi:MULTISPECIES: alpha/beta hydrolase [Actinomadura]|uniref:Alpha/beta hydrolase n=1 Tax=Actinomadura yumaensis TaxID=111807 RepID=A0ABW2CVZ3_9ACTN|nr:alpha/beta hydrolase [Actinomadura sp. J1-007]MWK39696.1 alpha/beta hydrolase fold domain-containing protein [Actinomadura sp. J1-007]
MPLDPEAQRIIDRVPAEDPAAPAPPPDAATMREEFGRMWTMPDGLPAVAAVADTALPGPGGDIPVRVYTPEGAGPHPAFVWFHGGGWTIGSLDENEFACRAVCAASGAAVVSVDYRLAPENPYPAAADDAHAVVRWIGEHGADLGLDPARIAVGGESAGGNLAAVTALRARDAGGPALALQVLVSPVLGHSDDGRGSYREFADGYFLTKASMDWFFTQYPRGAADLDDPYLLPLRAADLAGLPPALVLGAEYDVLRDEGEDYAKALENAGVPVEVVRYDGLIHGFFGLLAAELTAAKDAHARAAAALRSAFGGA